MGSPSIDRMFNQIRFEKTVIEIRDAVMHKITQLQAKIAERKERIAHIRKEFDINDQDLIQLLSEAANERTNPRTIAKARIIGAGVIQNLLTEQTFIHQETESVEKLARLARNIRPVMQFANNAQMYLIDTWELTDDELEFLGF